MNRAAAEYARALAIVEDAMIARSKGFSWKAALGYLRSEVLGEPARPAYDREACDRIVRLCDGVLTREREAGRDPLDLVQSTIERWVQDELHIPALG